jgi:DNA polymerase-3 subunit beta
MKVICDRAALMEGINLVSGAVAARTPRVQLTCVKLTATKSSGVGELILSATDAEIALKLSLSQVDVQTPGEALIPADKLRQIVSAEDSEPTLTLEVEGDAMTIRGRDAFFKVFGYPAAEFPPIPDFQSAVGGTAEMGKAKAVISHPAGSLSELVARTLFATAKENSRYAINGVRLALARANLTTTDKDAKAIACIIPVKALSMLQKLIRDHDEPVQIAITDNQALFSFGTAASPGRAVLISNLVEGTFPPYEDVIPKDQDKKVTFDRDVLGSAVRRAALLTNEESKGIKLSFSAKNKQVELSSRAPEMGEANIKADLTGYEGEAVEIGFNPMFISDALRVITDSEVVMELKAPNKPGLIKSGNDFLYVVMPVNLQ